MAVPHLPWAPEALKEGNTLRKGSCVHWIYGDVGRWLQRKSDETQIVGVELTDESIRLADLPAARTRTVVVLGNESHGIPRYRCVIEPLLIVSRGSDAVSAAWDTLLRTNEVTK